MSLAAAGRHIAKRRAFKGTRAAALSTFAFSARTHAILLIVSGSFVLETSSSCGLVVPMRALPRPMGRASRSTCFRCRRRRHCRHRRRPGFRPPAFCRCRLRVNLFAQTQERNARRFRSYDTIGKMLPLLPCPPIPLSSPPPVHLIHSPCTLELCKRSYLEATLRSFYGTSYKRIFGAAEDLVLISTLTRKKLTNSDDRHLLFDSSRISFILKRYY